jgi:uncharacterized protein (DUF488 family)
LKLYTIGFTKKTAEQFFSLLKNNNVKCVIDVRLNNKSQLAGFTKEEDLKYFLKAIAGIDYCHMLLFAPTDEMLKKYQDKEMSREDYQKEYVKVLDSRDVINNFDHKILSDACLLCSEPKPDKCHRRLLAEYLNGKIKDLEIIHL